MAPRGRLVRLTVVLLPIALLIGAVAATAQDASIVIESRTIRPDDMRVSVRLDSAVDVAQTVNDVTFELQAPIAPKFNGRPNCEVDPDIDKGGASFAFLPLQCTPGTCTGLRALVLALDNVTPIPSGAVLYTCALAPETLPGRYPLLCSNPKSKDPSGAAVDTACTDGEAFVESGTVLRTVFYSAFQGNTVPVEVNVFTNEPVVQVAVDLLVSLRTPVRSDANGGPACTPKSNDVEGTFTVLPDGCTAGVDCVGVHGVLASKSGTSLASGSVLYTCDVEVLPDTPTGNYRLQLTNMNGTDAGGATANVSGSDGSIGVSVRPPTLPPDPTPTPLRTNIEIGSVSGAAGSTVQIAATLHTTEPVSGVQNDLTFDPAAPIAARPDGKPACTATGLADNHNPNFAFQPPFCTAGVDCTGIRALLISLSVVEPFPDGTVLYTCDIAIAGNAGGHGTLHCSNALGSTPNGDPLPVGCADAEVEIRALDPTPTSTPPAPATATPTLRSGNSGQAGGGSVGCQVSAPATTAAAWPVLGLAAAILLRRKRR